MPTLFRGIRGKSNLSLHNHIFQLPHNVTFLEVLPGLADTALPIMISGWKVSSALHSLENYCKCQSLDGIPSIESISIGLNMAGKLMESTYRISQISFFQYQWSFIVHIPYNCWRNFYTAERKLTGCQN